MKKRILICLSLFQLFNLNAFDFKDFNKEKAETRVYLGGWSKHSKDENFEKEYKKAENKDFKYNENHKGLGFNYSIPYKETNHYLNIDSWYMKDSFNEKSVHFSLGYKYRKASNIIDSIDYGINLTLANRSFLERTSKVYHDLDTDEFILENDFGIKKRTVFMPMPYITFNLTDKISLDTAVMFFERGLKYSGVQKTPYFERESKINSVFFVRLGYKF